MTTRPAIAAEAASLARCRALAIAAMHNLSAPRAAPIGAATPEREHAALSCFTPAERLRILAILDRLPEATEASWSRLRDESAARQRSR